MMVLRDITLSGRLPQLRQLTYVTGGIVYPLGGRIHRWLADTYGDWRVALMYKEYNRYDTFEDAIRATYGRTLDQLSEEFQLAMRRDFYPSVDSLAPLAVLGPGDHPARDQARIPAGHGARGGRARSVYISPATGYLTVYRKRLDGGKPLKVVTAGRTADLESFHAFESRMDASRPGYLLFAARYGDRDALVVWDLETVRRWPGGISSTGSSRSCRRCGCPMAGASSSADYPRAGSPICIGSGCPTAPWSRSLATATRIWIPVPTPDGRRLVFASDRTAGGSMAPSISSSSTWPSGRVAQLTRGSGLMKHRPGDRTAGSTSPRDRDGVLNVFSADTLGRRSPGDLGLERRLRCGAPAGQQWPAGRRLSRSELEPVSLSGRLGGPGGTVHARLRPAAGQWAWATRWRHGHRRAHRESRTGGA